MSLIIETPNEDGTEWGVSFTSPNPEPNDYIGCLSYEDADRLDNHITRFNAERDCLQSELESLKRERAMLIDAIKQVKFESSGYDRTGEHALDVVGYEADEVLFKALSATKPQATQWLAEHDAKLQQLAKEVSIDIAEDWSQWVEADCAPHTNKGYMELEFDSRMASELRAKGEE
jgi:hypothetical protein